MQNMSGLRPLWDCRRPLSIISFTFFCLEGVKEGEEVDVSPFTAAIENTAKQGTRDDPM